MNTHKPRLQAEQTPLLAYRPKQTYFLDRPDMSSRSKQQETKTNTPRYRNISNYKRTIDYIIVALGLLVIPMLAYGADAYGTNMLKTEATNLQGLLFGPVLRIAGVIGAIFGIIRAFQTQSLQPIFIFGGIGAATIIIPKLLDAMFKVA